jgi:uncharacterized protein (AIM24 family)
MDYTVSGDVMQALQITLRNGEEVFAEAGSMLYMGLGIELPVELRGNTILAERNAFLCGIGNVDPHTPHPRWSQLTERMLGTPDVRRTMPFNGYGDLVRGSY